MNKIRQDAFTAFLAPYLTDSRLTIMTEAGVTRLTFDRWRRNNGVVIDTGEHPLTVQAAREVIISAGSVNTARLLQLSGIGPAPDL